MIIYCLASAAGLIVCLHGVRKYRDSKIGVCKSINRLDGKVVVITGANSGIGKETAKGLAKRGAIVVLACRNRNAALSAVEEIRSFTTDGDLIVVSLNLGDLSSVKRCAENILEKFRRIDILINNAGVVYPPQQPLQTTDGFEIHFGINHLGHFLFTQLLLERIKQTRNSRIIIVSSRMHQKGEINFDTIAKCQEKIRKGRTVLYSDSKLCNVLHAQELSRRLAGTSTGVYTLCPGFVYTGLFRNVRKETSWITMVAFLPIALLFMRTAKQGAECTLHCATSEDLHGIPFGSYRDCKPFPLCPKAQDRQVASDLWDLSMRLVKSNL